jgi:hypothetical protein
MFGNVEASVRPDRACVGEHLPIEWAITRRRAVASITPWFTSIQPPPLIHVAEASAIQLSNWLMTSERLPIGLQALQGHLSHRPAGQRLTEGSLPLNQRRGVGLQRLLRSAT